MSRKHYVKLAAILNSRLTQAKTFDATGASIASVECTAHDIADLCAEDNANFDRKRFLSACGLTVGHMSRCGLEGSVK